MAELIEQIVSEQAFKQVEKLKADLVALQTQFEQLIKTTNSGGGTGNSTAQLSEMQKILKEIVRLQERQNAMRTVHGEALVKEREAMRTLNAEMKTSERLRDAEEGSIDQLRKKLSDMERAYAKMGEAARNSMGGKDMIGNIQKTYTELTKLEQSMGRYQRNVGNYTNATFQLSQVFRELPAFTFSAQTGMMALSNNLPMLADAFKQVRQETGSTASALAVFGKSIFSLGNIFTILMSAFIIYNKEIMGLIRGTNDAKASFDRYADSIKDAEGEMALLLFRQQEFHDGIISKEKFLSTYNDTLGKVAGSTKDINVAERNTIELAPEYIKYAGMKAEATRLLAEAVNLYNKYADVQKSNDWWTILKAQASTMMKDMKFGGITWGFRALTDPAYAKQQYEAAAKAEFELASKQWGDLQKKLDQSQFSSVTDSVKDKAKGGGKTASSQKSIDRIEELKKQYELEKKVVDTSYQNGELSFLQYQLKLLRINEEYYYKRLGLIKNLNKKEKDSSIELMYDISKNNRESMNALSAYAKDSGDAYAKEYAKGLKQGIQNNMTESGLRTLGWFQEWLSKNTKPANLDNIRYTVKEQIKFLTEDMKMLDDLMRRFTDLGSAISDTIYNNEISGINSREKKMIDYYDEEEKRVKSSYTNKIQQEKELAKIEAKREAEQKVIDKERAIAARKRAQAQKAYDIANIITSTASAIMQTLEEYGATPLGLALSAIVGATGAAQVARAASTPLPEFAKGTDNAPEGFAKVSEKGQELVVEPSGKKWLTPAKESITYLKKGSKVIPNDKLMKMVQDNAFVQLSQMNMPITSDMYGKAMIDQFEELTNDIKALKNIMADKDMKVSVLGNFDHYMYIKKAVK